MEKKDSPNIGHNKKSLLNSPVEHIDIKSFDARKIIEGMGKMSFTSRDTARAAAIYNEMLADKDRKEQLLAAKQKEKKGSQKLKWYSGVFVSYVPEEDFGTRAGGKSQFKDVC